MTNQTPQLRKKLRSQRRTLSIFQHRHAEKKVLHALRLCPKFRHAQHIGVYLDDFGEVATHTLILYLFTLIQIMFQYKNHPLRDLLVAYWHVLVGSLRGL